MKINFSSFFFGFFSIKNRLHLNKSGNLCQGIHDPGTNLGWFIKKTYCYAKKHKNPKNYPPVWKWLKMAVFFVLFFCKICSVHRQESMRPQLRIDYFFIVEQICKLLIKNCLNIVRNRFRFLHWKCFLPFFPCRKVMVTSLFRKIIWWWIAYLSVCQCFHRKLWFKRGAAEAMVVSNNFSKLSAFFMMDELTYIDRMVRRIEPKVTVTRSMLTQGPWSRHSGHPIVGRCPETSWFSSST